MTIDDPVWNYLQDASLNNFHFHTADWSRYYGPFLEKLGVKIIRETYHHPKFNFKTIFPEFEETLSVKWLPHGKMSILKGRIDSVLQVNGKTLNGYSKKAIAFEIKSGASPIDDHHIAFWRELMNNPQTYISKCDRIKVFVFWIQGLDPYSHNLFYTLKEIKSEEIPPSELHIKRK